MKKLLLTLLSITALGTTTLAINQSAKAERFTMEGYHDGFFKVQIKLDGTNDRAKLKDLLNQQGFTEIQEVYYDGFTMINPSNRQLVDVTLAQLAKRKANQTFELFIKANYNPKQNPALKQKSKPVPPASATKTPAVSHPKQPTAHQHRRPSIPPKVALAAPDTPITKQQDVPIAPQKPKKVDQHHPRIQKVHSAGSVEVNVYDPRTRQCYQVIVENISNVKEELACATNLPKNLFLVDQSDLCDQDHYDLELPIAQVAKEGVLYNIYRNQEVVVAGLTYDNFYTQEVVIKSEINHQPVTRIGAGAFDYTSIRAITFEPNSTITTIDRDAFRGCRFLTNLALPNSVTKIGGNCFSDCTSLTKITLPDSLTMIGTSCFSNCRTLNKISLPNSLTYLGDDCFSNCQALTRVTLSHSLTSLGNDSFYNCLALTRIHLPHSLTMIGCDCFSGCQALSKITLPNAIAYLGSAAFENCSSLNMITLPNSLTKIGSHTFAGCKSLSAITLPDSLTRIETRAFQDCTSLQQINLGHDSQLQELGNEVFNNTPINEQRFREYLGIG